MDCQGGHGQVQSVVNYLADQDHGQSAVGCQDDHHRNVADYRGDLVGDYQDDHHRNAADCLDDHHRNVADSFDGLGHQSGRLEVDFFLTLQDQSAEGSVCVEGCQVGTQVHFAADFCYDCVGNLMAARHYHCTAFRVASCGHGNLVAEVLDLGLDHDLDLDRDQSYRHLGVQVMQTVFRGQVGHHCEAMVVDHCCEQVHTSEAVGLVPAAGWAVVLGKEVRCVKDCGCDFDRVHLEEPHCHLGVHSVGSHARGAGILIREMAPDGRLWDMMLVRGHYFVVAIVVANQGGLRLIFVLPLDRSVDSGSSCDCAQP
uniref:Uncharacterized protein n=1 Tax=Globisporangium ultimum (strain ATCC 200006 / CBS 805.95 / DAOM BR144) TaxID=431595 RepID=K3XAX5_GLOUD